MDKRQLTVAGWYFHGNSNCAAVGSGRRYGGDLELRVGGWGAIALHVDEPGGRGSLSHAQPIPQLLG